MSMGEVVRYAVDVLLLRAGETPISGGEGWGGEGRGGEERGGCWLEYVRRKCGVTVPRLLYRTALKGVFFGTETHNSRLAGPRHSLTM